MRFINELSFSNFKLVEGLAQTTLIKGDRFYIKSSYITATDVIKPR